MMSIDLIWIAVKDFEAGLKEYTQIFGFKILQQSSEWKWAELQSMDGGCILGLCEGNKELSAGSNAVVTITVKDLEQKKQELTKQGAKLVGETMVIPEQVKLQTLIDKSGNRLQIVQKL